MTEREERHCEANIPIGAGEFLKIAVTAIFIREEKTQDFVAARTQEGRVEADTSATRSIGFGLPKP